MSKDSPVIKQPLLGFRKWRVGANKRLYPMTDNAPWSPGINYSFCQGDHDAPKKNCECGFYAWYNYEDNRKSSYDGVIGAIAGVGEAQFHKTGFRISEAQIIALYSERESDFERLKEIAKNYGIPFFNDSEEFLRYAESKATSAGAIEEISFQDFIDKDGKNKADSWKSFGFPFIFTGCMTLLLFFICLSSDSPIDKDEFAFVMTMTILPNIAFGSLGGHVFIHRQPLLFVLGLIVSTAAFVGMLAFVIAPLQEGKATNEIPEKFSTDSKHLIEVAKKNSNPESIDILVISNSVKDSKVFLDPDITSSISKNVLGVDFIFPLRSDARGDIYDGRYTLKIRNGKVAVDCENSFLCES